MKKVSKCVVVVCIASTVSQGSISTFAYATERNNTEVSNENIEVTEDVKDKRVEKSNQGEVTLEDNITNELAGQELKESNSNTKDLENQNIKSVTSNKMNIDELTSTKYTDSVYVRGWVLNTNGTKEVNVYIDGKKVGQATTGLSRPDVNNAYPGYLNGANSGYEMHIGKNSISSGSHKIKIESVGIDGSLSAIEKTFELIKLPNRMSIDELTTTKYEDSAYVRGWTLNASGTKEVNVYVDGKKVGQATTGLSRSDVNSVYPGYPNGVNSGYEMKINKDSISSGVHKIKVEEVGTDGSVNTLERTFELVKLSNRTTIDELTTTKYTDSVYVRGWTLNASGTKEVNVYVDGKKVDQAIIGLSRPDVNSAYPGYPNGANSGYEIRIDKNSISSGKHTIKVEAVGKDGSVQAVEKDFELVKLISRVHIDKPTGTVNNEDIYVKGWALNDSGTKEVNILVDGKKVGQAITGLSRPDVNSAYPGYSEGATSGYEYTIDKNLVISGNHTIEVQVVANDNSVMTSKTSINMVKPKSRLTLDSPKGSVTLTNKELKVRGWALNASGIKQVKVYVNGSLKGNAEIEKSRPDVNSVYPGYPNGNKSGFEMSIDTSTLGAGKQIIKLEAIGNDGSIQTLESTINDIKIMDDTPWNYSFEYHLKKQVEKNSDIKISNGVYVKATEDDIRYYINSKNFMSQSSIYQFLKLNMYREVTSVDDLNNYLSSVLSNHSINPLHNQGQGFLDAAKEYSLDPLYLVAHTCLETGYGSSNLAKGYEVVLDNAGNAVYYTTTINGKEYKFVKIKDSTTPAGTRTVKVYNFFGIGAIDSAATAGGVTTAYEQGWITPQKAIKGAAKWISSSYINNSKYNQNTLYYMRWYCDTTNGNWHQYATDIGWADKISKLIYNMSYLYDSKNASMVFDVPQYNQSKILDFINNLFN